MSRDPLEDWPSPSLATAARGGQFAAMPLSPDAVGNPEIAPRFVSVPSAGAIANTPMLPAFAFREWRNWPSAEIAMSMFVEPLGLIPTTVPGRAVSAPAAVIERPEIVEDPALEVYTNLPSGVTTFQQLAVPSVGTLVLIGTSVPSAPMEYEETADAFAAPGQVSDTSAAPLGANVTSNAPGPALVFSLIAESVPSASTRKAGCTFGDEQHPSIRTEGDRSGRYALIIDPVPGELLIRRRSACGTGRRSRIARRSDADRRVGMRSRRCTLRACDHRARHERAADCTSRRQNAHVTESRVVLYRWHPWHGRSVFVFGSVTRGGQAILRCAPEQADVARSLEVPQWMFEGAACICGFAWRKINFGHLFGVR
jgi:hypothetical protein